jgi:hypothetical protein
VAPSPISPAPRSRRAPGPEATSYVLPAEGYQGRAPAFPLPGETPRELAIWHWAWTTPQASGWAGEPWRWRTVALWTRWSARLEDPDASAALGNVVVRLADQIGLSPPGLTENGWRIAESDTDFMGGRVALGSRRDRPGLSVRERLAEGQNYPRDEPVSSLERARRRHAAPQNDLRDVPGEDDAT